MNQVPVIVRNPAYVAEVELDEDGINPTDLAPLVRVTWKRLNTDTTQRGNVSKMIFEEFPFFLEIRGNPSKVQNC